MILFKMLGRSKLVGVVLTCLLGMPIAHATTFIDGSCAQQDTLKTDSDGNPVTFGGGRIMQAEQIVYEDAELQKPSSYRLTFGEKMLIKERQPVAVEGETRLALQVYRPNQDALGWVDAEDLLCRTVPLEYPSGLAKRLFVDTTNAQPITVYNRSDSDACAGSCQQVRRFDWVSAYADDEVQGRYLVSYRPDLLDDSYQFLGWIDKTSLLEWPTALALKPQDGKEVVQIPIEGSPAAGQDNLPLQGVPEWYSVDKLLPILAHDQERKVFRIAAPRHGIPLEDVLKNFPALENILSNVDIFFVLDGTESMDPYLASAKAWINTFSTRLSTDESLAGINFRFGFRVFRDKGHDQLFDSCIKGICESLPLNKAECAPPVAAQGNDAKLKEWSQASLRQFQAALEPVRAAPKATGGRKRIDSDFEEQLGAALNTVLEKDIRGCDQRIKLVFVIGDHGDTAARFRNAEIPTALMGQHRRLELFFLQTPNSSSASEAQVAYGQFAAQARTTVEALLKLRRNDKLSGGRVEDYLHTLDDAHKMLEIVQQRVGTYASKRSIEELRNDLLKGTDASKSLWDSVRATGRYPVLYLQLAQETLGEGFDRETLNDVAQFEVPDDDSLVERFVWRTKPQLNVLTRDLEAFRDLNLNNQGNPAKQRELLIKTLDEQIKRITGEDYDRNKTLQEVIEDYKGKAGRVRKALPFGTASPLLQYSMEELEDLTVVRTDCELPALIRRAVKAHEALLRLSQEPNNRISYQLKAAMPDTCGSPKGGKQVIQALELNAASDAEPLAPPTSNGKPVDRKAYSYCHSTYGGEPDKDKGEVCWIPFALLP